jgi:hypothetical protein
VNSLDYQINKVVRCYFLDAQSHRVPRTELGLQRYVVYQSNNVPSPLAPPDLYMRGQVPIVQSGSIIDKPMSMSAS